MHDKNVHKQVAQVTAEARKKNNRDFNEYSMIQYSGHVGFGISNIGLSLTGFIAVQRKFDLKRKENVNGS